MMIEHISDALEAKSEILKSNSELHCAKCGSTGHDTKDHGKNGGKRKGAGKPKGKKSAKTLEREEALRQFRDRVAKNTDRLLNAQLSKAVGEQMLFVKVTERDSKGKIKRSYFERVESQEIIQQYLDDPDAMGDDEHYYFITTRPADNKAIDSLLDRTYGKAQQNIDVTSGKKPIPILGGISVSADDSAN